MTKHEIIHIIKHLFRQLEKAMHAIVKHPDHDSIHKFRVQIKKLRAFLRLLSFNMNIPGNLKIPKKLKKIYSVAGEVRSLQLQLSEISKLSENNHEFTQYHHQLENDLESRIAELKILMEDHNSSGKEKKIISKLPGALDDTAVLQFYEWKNKSLKSIIELKNFSDEELHSIRKMMKDMIYVSKIQQEYGDESVQASALDEKNLSTSEKIAEKLGALHDLTSGLQLLTPAHLTEIGLSERQKLETIRSKWDLKKLRLRAVMIRTITSREAFQTGN